MATQVKLSHLLKDRKVDSVRQREAILEIDFQDGSTLSVVLASSAGSVKLMSSDDEVEFSE